MTGIFELVFSFTVLSLLLPWSFARCGESRKANNLRPIITAAAFSRHQGSRLADSRDQIECHQEAICPYVADLLLQPYIDSFVEGRNPN